MEVLAVLDDLDKLEITPVSTIATTKTRKKSDAILANLPSQAPSVSLEDLQSRVNKLESEIKTVNFDRNKIDVGWDEKMIPDNQYYPWAKKLADRRLALGEQLWAETVALRNKSIEVGMALNITPENDGSLYFPRLNLYKDPAPSGKTQKTIQAQLRKDAIQIYGSDVNTAKVSGQKFIDGRSVIVQIPQLACPVLRQWFGEDEMTAAHILPAGMSPAQIDYYFGAGFGSRKYTFDNCLFVHKEIESFMLAGLMVFVPSKPDMTADGRQISWKIKILRKKAVGFKKLTAIPGKTLGGLDGVELYWKNANRPSTRFLYFHYLISHLRNKEYAQLGSAEDWEQMLKNNAFAGCGPFWARGHLEGVMDFAGHVRDEDVARIAEGTTRNSTVEEMHSKEVNEYARRLLAL
jgi:hypothetical protein